MTAICLRKNKIQDEPEHILIANHVLIALKIPCLWYVEYLCEFRCITHKWKPGQTLLSRHVQVLVQGRASVIKLYCLEGKSTCPELAWQPGTQMMTPIRCLKLRINNTMKVRLSEQSEWFTNQISKTQKSMRLSMISHGPLFSMELRVHHFQQTVQNNAI